MLKIPEAIGEKKGRLTPQEYELVKTHVMQTVEQLRNTSGLSTEIADIAALHHERRDGSGCPLGRKDDALGVLGAIAGIVDVFDALTAARPYAVPMSPSNALSFLNKLRGKTFHQVLVEQFVRCIGFFPVGSRCARRSCLTLRGFRWSQAMDPIACAARSSTARRGYPPRTS